MTNVQVAPDMSEHEVRSARDRPLQTKLGCFFPGERLTQPNLRRPPIPRSRPIPDVPREQANTQQVHFENRGFAHTEGGWPKEVDPTEICLLYTSPSPRDS